MEYKAGDEARAIVLRARLLMYSTSHTVNFLLELVSPFVFFVRREQ